MCASVNSSSVLVSVQLTLRCVRFCLQNMFDREVVTRGPGELNPASEAVCARADANVNAE